jgi:O-antigen/teichoic acid export membrane protein
MSIQRTEIRELNLKQKTIRGSLFQVFGRFSLRFLKVIRTIIIARFLFPEDVGLFVLASILLGLTEIFLQSGFQSALVQRDVVERRHLDGVWTIHCVKNLLLGIGVYSTAPLFASFFNNDALIPILQVLALLYIIESVVNIGTILMQKEMQFGRQLLYDASYVLTELVATVIFAYFLRDVWALVYGALVGRFASVVFSYVFHEYRPRLTKDFSGARELFTFGRWIWLTSIFIFISTKLDSFFIGKFLSVKDLGFYQLALSLALLPAVEVSRSLATVLFPLFSKIQKIQNYSTQSLFKHLK